MKKMYVYLLLCADDSYYCGVTNDLITRLCQHRESFNPNSYTSSRLPISLVHFEIIYGPLKAIAREKQIKSWSRAKKLALIHRNYEELSKLAKKEFVKLGEKR